MMADDDEQVVAFDDTPEEAMKQIIAVRATTLAA